MYIYLLEQNNKIKIGKTINMEQRYKQLSSIWGEFNDNSCFFEFSLSKLKTHSLSIDNIEKTIHRLLKSKGLYLNNLKKKDGYKEFFKKDDTNIRQIIYDNFEDFILEEFDLSDIKNIPEYIDDIEVINSKKSNEIKMHPSLISGRHNWNTNEIKIVLNSLKYISENNLIVKLKRNEIMRLIEDQNISTRDLKNISQKLASKIFEIHNKEKNKWSVLTWFSKIEYDDGIFLIEYNYHMQPYLLDLKKNFTKFNIQNILPMKSNYSMRIYQLLKQYQRIGSRSFTVDELRDILTVPTSYTYNNLKNKVLLKAQQEMEEYSDLTFDFEEIKTGRRITEIKFNIKRKENNKHIQIEDKEDNPWYFSKYYGKCVLQSDITYENITEIKESEKYLTIIFEDEDSIKVKDEDALIKILID